MMDDGFQNSLLSKDGAASLFGVIESVRRDTESLSCLAPGIDTQHPGQCLFDILQGVAHLYANGDIFLCISSDELFTVTLNLKIVPHSQSIFKIDEVAMEIFGGL